MDVTDTGRTWRIGKLAGMAHVSARTLRHYDAIGLLRSVSRTEAGHRLSLRRPTSGGSTGSWLCARSGRR